MGMERMAKLYRKFQKTFGSAALAVIGVAAIGLVSAPPAVSQDISFADQIQPIIAERCAVCHSESPTQRGYIWPPNDVTFDTPAQIQALAGKIEAWAINTPIMPLLNETNMTQDERDLVGAWITAGADIAN